MTRFQRELNGEFGAYWRNAAEQKIEELKGIMEHEIRTTIGGAAFWVNSGNFLPEEVAVALSYTDFPFSLEETNRARKEQEKLFLERYRATYTGPSEEELIELKAAFGSGTILNVLTGEEIRL